MNQPTLSAGERETYRKRLHEMTTRLASEVTQLEAETLRPATAQPTLAPHAQDAEPAVRDAEEEVGRTLLISEEHLLSEVNAALARLKDGTFGKCEQCGHQLTRARLEAMPYARTCIRCAKTNETTPQEE